MQDDQPLQTQHSSSAPVGDTSVQQTLGGAAGNTHATQIFTGLSGNLQLSSTESQAPVSLVHVVKGPYAGESFCLNKDLITIGRDPECSIFLNDMTVSREHCKLERRDGFWHLTDCGSLNGTWVNGAIVSEADLQDGASIQIGTYVLVLHVQAQSM